MNYQPRISADPIYLRLLGQTLYNFSYLEWIVIWIVSKLDADGQGRIPRGEPTSELAKALAAATVAASPRLTDDFCRRLSMFNAKFRTAIRTREDLFKVHSSAPKIGVEEVEREYEWPRATLVAAARLFEEVAFEGDEILHGGWSK